MRRRGGRSLRRVTGFVLGSMALLPALLAGCGGSRPTSRDLIRADPGDTLYTASSGPWAPPPAGTPSGTPLPAAGGRVPGFPVQIYRSLSLVDAESQRAAAERLLERVVEVEFRPPYYRVLVGASRTRSEAEALRESLERLGFDAAVIVEGLVMPE